MLCGFALGFWAGYFWVVWLLSETYRDTPATYLHTEDGHIVTPQWRP